MQFVEFNSAMQENTSQRKEESFALAALMEIPDQYRAILSLNHLGYALDFIHHDTLTDQCFLYRKTKGVSSINPPLPPPIGPGIWGIFRVKKKYHPGT